MTYSNDLTYISSDKSPVLPFSQPVVCAYERWVPKDWYPLIYDPVFETYDLADLEFHFGIMNGGCAASLNAALQRWQDNLWMSELCHQPLLLLLEECVAATTPELQPESSLYPIIANKGCLVDSKISRSRFEQRRTSSEILLSLQAFRFGVFIHCKLVAWDPVGLDGTKKACHYDKQHGWQLLDNTAYSSLCDCCESTCKSRKMRSPGSGT
uniref:ZP-C domain-containing protein n=1 Tax=Mola mola TaxID=94237 RepID=A0A3Q3X671_MOLML